MGRIEPSKRIYNSRALKQNPNSNSRAKKIKKIGGIESENWKEDVPVAAKDFLSSITSNHLEDGIDVDDRMVRLEVIRDDEPTRGSLKQVLDRERDWSTGLAEVEALLLIVVTTQIRIAAIPFHLLV